MGINYDDVQAYDALADETIGPHWVLENYRKVTFATAPTDNLLTWLQSNAVKQASDTAVQPSKALTVTSNGTTTITPDAPYDAIKQVDLTVNVASGGGTIDYNTIATTWAKYGCNFNNADDKVISVTGNFTGLAAVLSPYGAFAVFTLGNPMMEMATSLCLNGYVWCFTSIDNGELSVLNTAENISFAFMADKYIYLQPA